MNRLLDCNGCPRCKTAEEQYDCLTFARKMIKRRRIATILNLSCSLFCCGLMAYVGQQPTEFWWAKAVVIIAFGFNAFLAIWNFKRLIGVSAEVKTVDSIVKGLVKKMEATKLA